MPLFTLCISRVFWLTSCTLNLLLQVHQASLYNLFVLGLKWAWNGIIVFYISMFLCLIVFLR